MKKHRTVWGLVAAALGVTLLLVGVATASNMGFKFVPQIPGTAGANAYNLSLPWNNNYTDAASLLNDIPGATKVSQFTSNAGLVSWVQNAGGTLFTVRKGEAYIVYGSGSGQTPVIVGSHDPSYTYTFTAGQAFNASAPYHQTLTSARDLFLSIETKCAGSMSKVSKFTPASGLVSWLGDASGGTNFNLDLGSGVVIFTKATCSGYVWPHY
ncbi:MAG: hypothetical protein ABFD84_14005 [Candidatus Polarisedimenticolia bacterium]